MDPSDEETWRRALLRFRADKDKYMKESQDSPLTPEEKAYFKGLHYFDPDQSLRFDEVKLQRYPEATSVIMTTSKGTRQLFNRVGSFEFEMARRKWYLQAYQPATRDDPSLFVPFRDSTSGGESYGAARYLDMEVEPDDSYVLDFNYAYNPYCAYNDGYVCPLPPAENKLDSPVRAGERKYHQ